VSIELGLWALAFVTVVCLLSGFAHGALGFGFPIVATPLVALVIDIKSAIALLAPVTLVLVLISALRGAAPLAMLREFWFLPVAIAVGAWLGTRLLIAAPPEPFLLVLAFVMLLYLNLDRLGRGHSERVQRQRAVFGIAFGFAAGVFEAIANVAGPVLLIYFMHRDADARPHRRGDLPQLAAQGARHHGRASHRSILRQQLVEGPTRTMRKRRC